MSVKKSAISAVPRGSFSTRQGGEEPQRKRTVSDEYLKDEAAERAIEEASLDELIVPSGNRPDEANEASAEASDVHDLVIQPTEIPDESSKQGLFAKAPAEQRPVKRGRFFSSISSALVGASEKSEAGRSELEKSLREAVERAKKKP
jgi:hypothetical protein